MNALQVAVLFGALLAASVHARCLNDCSGHGDCESGVCVCEEGWEGEDCNTYKCDLHADGCSGHGQCRSSSCVCHAAFGGYNCASRTDNCPDHCKGHGSCLDGVCTCDVGYKGSDCGIVDPSYSCPQNCSGHGFCDVSTGSPTCFCMPSYWSGESCDKETSKCPADLNNCTGHGICGPKNALIEDSEWVCACEVGFCGTSCNRACPACPNNCTGHGICQGTVCACDPGFAGDDCTLVVPVESCPNNCSGHGRCLETTPGSPSCVCEEGFGGDSCVLVDWNCPANCSGKGECLPGGICACKAGFAGAGCERALGSCLASNNCSANGICVNGSCHCYPGFGGADCSMACHTGGIGDVGCNADKGHGVCINGTCVCRDGEWEGVGCETATHSSTMGKVASSSNPIGIIVISVVGAAVLILLAGVAYNYATNKRGLNAVPGMSGIRSTVKGEDFEETPHEGSRFVTNY